MKLAATDYALVRIAQKASGLCEFLGRMESSFLRHELDAISIEKPIFIAGLARSGTTILLEQLVRTDLFATHRYRDFPFLHTPVWWNKYLDIAAQEQDPVERPHKDRIAITSNSPEAFEEPLWQHFFNSIHAPGERHLLDSETENDNFERAFRDHLRKILLVRKRDRYLSKGNYNVTRLEYLAKLFPDTQFVIPIRHPVDHVNSLAKQHQLFLEYAETDDRIAAYLRYAGHYEFGPQRQAIRLNKSDGDRTDAAWEQDQEHLGYAIQWSQVYRYIDSLRHESNLAERIHVIRYEDFCEQPKQNLKAILQTAELDASVLDDLSFDHISKSQRHVKQSDTAEQIWRETGLVAQLFGYSKTDSAPESSSKILGQHQEV